MTTVEKKSTRKSTSKKTKPVNITVSVTDNKADISPAQKVEKIEFDLISCNPFNPRKHNAEEDLQELASSIKVYGVIQPITVRTQGGFFEIVCGERRYLASLIAGLKTIPAIVTQMSDEEAMEVTIVENLQRKDISPVEESNAFKLLIEKRSYSIEELAVRFSKSDSYIRGRLQLCNLITEIADLLSANEITIIASLELSKLCTEIQTDIFNDHLKESDGYQCWRSLKISELRSRIEQKYCTDLSKYDFDKTECRDCHFNSALQDLFAVDNCGNCQNISCLQEKQKAFMVNITTQIVDAGQNFAACVIPNTTDPALVGQLKEKGIDVLEILPNRFPEKPEKPLAENFESTEEYNEAIQEYETDIVDYEDSLESIKQMQAEGKIQNLVDVSGAHPVVCYRVVSEESTETKEDPIAKLIDKDKRNKEISIEKTVADVKAYISDKSFPDSIFSDREEMLLYFVMFSTLRRSEYRKFGLQDPWLISDEKKIKLAEKLTVQQKTTLKRDYISSYLSGANGAGKLSELLMEFASLHFPDAVGAIKKQHDDVYEKRHKSLSERIQAAEKTINSAEKDNAVITDEVAETVDGAEFIVDSVDEGFTGVGVDSVVDVVDTEFADNSGEPFEITETEDTSEILAYGIENFPLPELHKPIFIDEKAELVMLEAV